MQLYALIALLSVAVATPARRQLFLMPGITGTPSGSCIRYTAQRECGLGGDRVLTCTDGESLCLAGWSTKFNATDLADNQAACSDKAEGFSCDTFWTCCPEQ